MKLLQSFLVLKLSNKAFTVLLMTPIKWSKNVILCMNVRIMLDVNRKRVKLRAVSAIAELLVSVEFNQNVLSKTKTVEFILRKIIKIVATRCSFLRLECTKSSVG